MGLLRSGAAGFVVVLSLLAAKSSHACSTSQSQPSIEYYQGGQYLLAIVNCIPLSWGLTSVKVDRKIKDPKTGAIVQTFSGAPYYSHTGPGWEKRKTYTTSNNASELLISNGKIYGVIESNSFPGHNFSYTLGSGSNVLIQLSAITVPYHAPTGVSASVGSSGDPVVSFSIGGSEVGLDQVIVMAFRSGIWKRAGTIDVPLNANYLPSVTHFQFTDTHAHANVPVKYKVVDVEVDGGAQPNKASPYSSDSNSVTP